MTYDEAYEYIKYTDRYGSKPGLETVTELLGRVGNPQDSLKFVHVAGTNGKGSVLAYVSSALTEAGYKTGRYISPAVYDYREKIQIDAAFIPKDAVARLVAQVRDVCGGMVADGFRHPTTFEIETAVAFLYFKENDCDIVVAECGMGGRGDATNVIKTSLVSIITRVGLDHMEFLGDTLYEIAAQKAGIVKPGNIVVSAPQEDEAEEALASVCREAGVELRVVRTEDIVDARYIFEAQRFSYKDMKRIKASLLGSWQVENAAVAIEAVWALGEKGFPVSEEALRKGLSKTMWPGRFMTLDRHPLFIADGAHNRDAADALLQTLGLYFRDKRKIFIAGVLADKDYDYIMSKLAPLAERIIAITPPDNQRALDAEVLAEDIRQYNANVETAGSIREAVHKARAYAREEDLILAFGSLSYMGGLIREARMED